MKKSALFFGIVFSALLFPSCGDYGNAPTPTDRTQWIKDQLAQTPREDVEAEQAALWYSNELVAPEWLYQKFHNDLQRIRANDWGISQVRTIHFFSNVPISQILVRFDSSSIVQLRRGEYRAWDSVNALLRVNDIDTLALQLAPTVKLTFEGIANGDSLANSYRGLPGVTSAGPDILGGDDSNVYPWLRGEKRTYLFREGSEDCPSGCLVSEYWYFRVTDEKVEYVGHAYRNFPEQIWQRPDWWGEAFVARCMFESLGHCDMSQWPEEQ